MILFSVTKWLYKRLETRVQNNLPSTFRSEINLKSAILSAFGSSTLEVKKPSDRRQDRGILRDLTTAR